MKKNNRFFFLLGLFFVLRFSYCLAQSTDKKDENGINYQLSWSDEFNGTHLDSNNWRFSSWYPMCTDNNFLAYVSNGTLVLRAIKNPDTTDTTKKYIAGCIETKDKKSFLYGKLEVRAKLNTSQGSWPAIWLKPVDPSLHKSWPTCGEIDIMEHLNNDPFIHASLHSFNRMNKVSNTPIFHATSPINVNQFNIYGMTWQKDSICLFINHQLVLKYPRIESMGEKQWPYDVPFFLLLNQVLGGWAGKINDETLPATMEVDWVRYYLPQK